MANNMRHLLAASILIGGAALLGGAVPASADYVPFTIVDPVAGPAGTVITARGNTWCATTTQEPGENIQPGVPGTVVVEFGIIDWPPGLSSNTELDVVLATTTVDAGPDGRWSAQLTVPEGTPPGTDYAVVGHCTVFFEGEAPGTSTTTTETSTSSEVPPPDGTPTRAVAQVDGVLAFDFFPAQFEVTASAEPPASTPPSEARPADPVAGQADFTG